MPETKTPSCEQLIELLPHPYMIIDRNYKIVAANTKYRDHYGVQPGQVVGRLCHEVSHHSPVPCHENGEHCPMLSVFGKKQQTQVMHIHYDREGNEERVQLHATPLLDEDGNVAFMAEAVMPLAENKEPVSLIVGRSRPILRLISMLQRVAPTTTTVLLQGESGVGKECAAQFLHRYSDRHEGPYVVVDCGILGETLIERELFGHEKGAFTGATSRKPGLFEAANGGTLVIDEISELPLSLQTKLLRVLETGTFRRIGGTDYISVDIRVIAATNMNLVNMVESGRFRRDLYYRLSAFPVDIPSLRERKDDIAVLSETFLKRCANPSTNTSLSAEVLEKLLSYDYPGNVRELRNILERASILSAGQAIGVEHIIFDRVDFVGQQNTQERGDSTPVLHTNRPLSEKDVMAALQASNGHRAIAAQRLGVSERTVYRYIQRLRTDPA